MYTIQNNLLNVSLSPMGAEVHSVLDNQGREWMWQADPKAWGWHAPLCFPFVGKLKDQVYTYQNFTYAITGHGFARDMEFTCTQQSRDSITFQLKSTTETLDVYPFPFVLEVNYTLRGQFLEKNHRIINPAPEPMYYEIGGHDAYALGFEGEEDFFQCSLILPQIDQLEGYVENEIGLLTTQKRQIPHENGKFSLDFKALKLGCYVLENLPQRGITLADSQGKARLRMAFPDFPYLVLWTNDKRFFCIEPWSTLPDATFVGRDITQKKGVRHLPPESEEKLSFVTEFILT